MEPRILIIDSGREYSESLREELQSIGYEVRTKSDGAPGIEDADVFAPSVIITDALPPGGASLISLEEIRTRHPHTPIIVAANDSSIETAVRAIQEQGAYHYFEKPVDPAKLRVGLERPVELPQPRPPNEILPRQLRD